MLVPLGGINRGSDIPIPTVNVSTDNAAAGIAGNRVARSIDSVAKTIIPEQAGSDKPEKKWTEYVIEFFQHEVWSCIKDIVKIAIQLLCCCCYSDESALAGVDATDGVRPLRKATLRDGVDSTEPLGLSSRSSMRASQIGMADQEEIVDSQFPTALEESIDLPEDFTALLDVIKLEKGKESSKLEDAILVACEWLRNEFSSVAEKRSVKDTIMFITALESLIDSLSPKDLGLGICVHALKTGFGVKEEGVESDSEGEAISVEKTPPEKLFAAYDKILLPTEEDRLQLVKGVFSELKKSINENKENIDTALEVLDVLVQTWLVYSDSDSDDDDVERVGSPGSDRRDPGSDGKRPTSSPKSAPKAEGGGSGQVHVDAASDHAAGAVHGDVVVSTPTGGSEVSTDK